MVAPSFFEDMMCVDVFAWTSQSIYSYVSTLERSSIALTQRSHNIPPTVRPQK